MEATQIIILRPLLELKILDSRKCCQIENRLTIDNKVEDWKAHQKNCLDHLKRMGMNRLQLLAVQYQPKGRWRIERSRRRWIDNEHLEL
jgi:hypothetical protein